MQINNQNKSQLLLEKHNLKIKLFNNLAKAFNLLPVEAPIVYNQIFDLNDSTKMPIKFSTKNDTELEIANSISNWSKLFLENYVDKKLFSGLISDSTIINRLAKGTNSDPYFKKEFYLEFLTKYNFIDLEKKIIDILKNVFFIKINKLNFLNLNIESNIKTSEDFDLFVDKETLQNDLLFVNLTLERNKDLLNVFSDNHNISNLSYLFAWNETTKSKQKLAKIVKYQNNPNIIIKINFNGLFLIEKDLQNYSEFDHTPWNEKEFKKILKKSIKII